MCQLISRDDVSTRRPMEWRRSLGVVMESDLQIGRMSIFVKECACLNRRDILRGRKLIKSLINFSRMSISFQRRL
jgi:hypothetical protein